MNKFKVLKPVLNQFFSEKILIFYILIASLFTASWLIPDFLLKIFIDNYTLSLSDESYTSFFQDSLNLLYILIGVIIFQRVAMIIQPKIAFNISQKLRINFANKLFNKVINLDYYQLSNKNSGKLVSKINRGSSSFGPLIQILTWSILPFFVNAPLIIFYLFTLNKVIALLLLLKLLLYIIISLRYSNKRNNEYRFFNKNIDVFLGNLTDYISNFKIIKTTNNESYVSKKFNSNLNFLNGFGKRMGDIQAKWNLYSRMPTEIIQIIILVYSYNLLINDLITVGSLVIIFNFTYRIIRFGDYFIYSYDGLLRESANFSEANKLLLIKPKILDSEDSKEIKIKKGKIEFNNVSFKYEDKNVFSNFNLEVKPGQSLGVVGKSGAGKSTLINILFRLFDLDKGYISIDNQNIKFVKQNSLRNSISYVPQETLLFDDSIYNNVLFAKPNSNRREVINAIKSAELTELIKSLPDKENTIVGEKGLKLSGGQRQRIGIARAILSNKKIIILDEATSSLDSNTELKIRDTIEKITQDKTTITIAHRLSTVMNSDKIVVFDDGKIVEVGDHKSLLKKKGKYAELWKYQTKGYL
jgi:ABC-type multidrug transport system fused ATPase/permease subunit